MQWGVEVQEEALRLFENGLLFPMDPETNRVNVFPDVVPCDAPLQVLDDKAITSEEEMEYSVHDSDEESQNGEPSEGDHVYDPSNHPRGRRSGTRSNNKS